MKYCVFQIVLSSCHLHEIPSSPYKQPDEGSKVQGHGDPTCQGEIPPVLYRGWIGITAPGEDHIAPHGGIQQVGDDRSHCIGRGHERNTIGHVGRGGVGRDHPATAGYLNTFPWQLRFALKGKGAIEKR
jgi:hypothetical protein